MVTTVADAQPPNFKKWNSFESYVRSLFRTKPKFLTLYSVLLESLQQIM
ncbi:hypothetical protein P8625_00355 [Tenacibaculum tangerinum]|uniref:Uncharacterized protein n=1 Tax=Tenacibaculum tangerinum TaxID=3038772 RepID=A0ABY8L5K8_9FLAO|nr:hypothetical protein [Tenacibaculum tangerinum]WGH75648.1 hypothetical protein P8625_00355 [Tenacibaculum tangerinum]